LFHSNNGLAKIILPTPFPVGDVNVYVIKGDLLTLVDVGPKTEEAWMALNRQLKELHLSTNDIEQVILTHHHPDHSGLLDYLPKSIPVYGHPLNDPWLSHQESFFTEHEAFFVRLFHEFGIPEQFLPYIGKLRKTFKYFSNRSLDGFLTEGDRPKGLDEWQVIETPGHAQSHIGLYREKDGSYIGGDQLLAHISPNPLLEPPLQGETERIKPQLQLNESLKKLAQIPISCVYAGHGEDITEVQELIDKRLNRQHERAMQVKSWLLLEELTGFEICLRLFPTLFQREPLLTLSETVAQLDYLLSLKEINSIEDGIPFRYKAK
jgi:glyoxylase-like metal-dependent hydrolase (beta-lactamase superfamily II)